MGKPIGPRSRRNDALAALGGSISGAGVTVPNAMWVKAQANWAYSGGTPPSQGGPMATVSVKRCTSSAGTTETGTAFTAYLPAPPSMDPNVISGDVFACQLTPEGDHAIAGSQDAAIGASQMWTRAASTIPSGWAKMDGVANAADNGGTGVVMAVGATKRFPRATDADGDLGATGGATNHTHAAHAASAIDDHAADNTGGAGGHNHSIASSGAHNHTVTASEGSHTHTITSTGAHAHTTESGYAVIGAHNGNTNSSTVPLDNHKLPNHHHTVANLGNLSNGSQEVDWEGFGDAGSTDEWPGTPDVYLSHLNTSHTHVIYNLTHTDTGHVHSILSSGAHNHSATGGTHDHTITVSQGAHTHTTNTIATHVHTTPVHSHSGSLTHDTVDIIPPFAYVYFIERLDNAA